MFNMFKKKTNWNKKLIAALRNDDLQEAAKCLDAGAGANCYFRTMFTSAASPVLVATIEKDDVDMLKFLIKKGLDINAIKGSENYKVPPVMLCMIYGKYNTFKFLLEHKDIDLKVSGEIYTADGRFPCTVSSVFDLASRRKVPQKMRNMLERAKIIALQREHQTGEVTVLPKTVQKPMLEEKNLIPKI